MAVNILGVVTATLNGENFELPSLTSFYSSVEPLSLDFLFKKKRWKHIYQFSEVRPSVTPVQKFKLSSKNVKIVAVDNLTSFWFSANACSWPIGQTSRGCFAITAGRLRRGLRNRGADSD